MKFFKIFIFSFILIGCSQTEQLIYKTDYPLTEKKAKFNTTNLKVNVPKGWYVAKENFYSTIDVWLLEDNLSAQIAFLPINVNNFNKKVTLKDVYDWIYKAKKTEVGNKFKEMIPTEHFYINGTEFYALQYLDNNQLPIRTVVFNVNDIFLECTASFNENIKSEKVNSVNLFNVQNSVLNSLTVL